MLIKGQYYENIDSIRTNSTRLLKQTNSNLYIFFVHVYRLSEISEKIINKISSFPMENLYLMILYAMELDKFNFVFDFCSHLPHQIFLPIYGTSKEKTGKLFFGHADSEFDIHFTLSVCIRQFIKKLSKLTMIISNGIYGVYRHL